MSSLLATTVAGAIFGVSLAAPPGPMNAIIAEESVLRGWTAGVRAGFGALLADAIFFVLTLGGVTAVVQEYALLSELLYLLGGGLMLFFAVDAATSARAEAGFVDGEAAAGATGFQKAFVLALTNPYQIAFWLTVGVGLARPGTLALADHVPAPVAALVGELVVETGSPTLVGGFFGGIVVWVTAFPAALVAGRRRVEGFAPVIAAGSAAVLAGFGLLFCWLGATALL
ncbi:MAG: LysE family translocator [Halohasta sp.]